MADETFTVSAPRSVSVGLDAIDRLVAAGSGAAALLYLYCLRAGGPVSAAEASAALGFTGGETAAAAERLRDLGLLGGQGENAKEQRRGASRVTAPVPERPDETPEYTAEDIKNALARGGDFPALVRETQKSLGKVLSSDDLIKLFGIYDGLGMPCEVILQLVTYCIGEQRRKFGQDRVPTMRYIEKAAYSWERAGVLTLERAEEYIRELEARRGAVSEMKTALGIRDRDLSATERRYVESWIAMGFSPEAAAVALDRTLVQTGKLSWGYMNSILKSWNEKGLRTPEEIERGDARASAPAAAQAQGKAPRRSRSAPTEAEYNEILTLLNDMKEEK